MEILGSELRASPDLYPLSLDVIHDSVYFVRLSQASYAEASFLDDRIVAGGPPDGGWAPWAPVRAAAAGLPSDGDFIFHIGHVGSTLVSRLLGRSARIFSVREPAALRTLAQMAFELPSAESPWNRADFDDHADVLLRLWSRTYSRQQKTLLKATSMVSEIAALLLARSSSAKAILMMTAPRVYMATILGGPASRVELRMAAQARLRRLHRRVGADLWRLRELSEGEIAAMSWACEMAALDEAAQRHPERVLWLDFEDFLAAPTDGLSSALRHLHGAVDAAEVAAMAQSPLVGRYSKGLEHAYDADLRRQVLDQARAEHAGELAKGMAWLERAAKQSPIVAAALSAAGPTSA